MSASEKLKGLEQYGRSMGTMPHYAIGGNPVPDNMQAWERYRDALPQIVAVVEAAEGITGSQESQSLWGQDVLATLAALERALSDG